MSALQDLEAMLSALSEGRTFTREDRLAFVREYRRLVSTLAELRARAPNDPNVARMERLLLRAHAELYVPEPPRFWKSLAAILLDFPATVKARWRSVTVATVLLFGAAIFADLEVRREPASAAALLNDAMIMNAEHFVSDEQGREGNPLYGAWYFTNNSSVAFNSYALGVTVIGTPFMLAYNGVLLGATHAMVGRLGSPTRFYGFIAPHGLLELFAIVVAAAAGLQLAWSLIMPGFRTRRQALREAARDGLPLVLGASFLLAIAGVIEGWVSPQMWPLEAKLAFGAVVDLSALYWLLRGSARPPRARARP